jgi:hypothetical protein
VLALPVNDLHAAGKIQQSEKLSVAADTLRKKLVETQREALPQLRDAYGPALRKALWEEDGSAKTFGTQFRTIDVVHPGFASNKNIKVFHSEARSVLAQLRFTRVNYKWIKDPIEFSYFDLDPPKDTDLVVWKGGGSYITVP